MRKNNEGLAQGVLKKGANGSGLPQVMKNLKTEVHFFEIPL